MYLRKRTTEASLGGGEDLLEKQHQGGKLTARERVDALVDPGSFEETGMFAEHRATLFGMAGKTFPAGGVGAGGGWVGGPRGDLGGRAVRVAGRWAGEGGSGK